MCADNERGDLTLEGGKHSMTFLVMQGLNLRGERPLFHWWLRHKLDFLF